MNMERPHLPITGGCSCDSINYEISSFPLLLYTCSCTDCQTASGSAFALNMPVRVEAFRITKGAPRAWRRPAGTSVATSWFCMQCSARLYGERSGRAEVVNVRAGTLHDTSWLVPAGHFYMRSAQSWLRGLNDTNQFEQEPDDFTGLISKWRTNWAE
jgi:hypothetical protein